MSYHPNFKDPRIVKRVRTALGFSIGVFSPTNAMQWSTKYIDQYFGQQQNQLSKYLRSVILIVVSNRWSKDTGECKSYKLNQVGVQFLKDSLRGSTEQGWDQVQNIKKDHLNTSMPYCITSFEKRYDAQLITELYKREYKDQLESKQFTYNEASSRLYHPLQSLKRECKADLLAESGLVHQYDIECCAPTLIHQYAQMQEDPMDLYLFALRDYIKDRQHYRELLAEDLGISEKAAKILINALFCGARIGLSTQFATSEILNHDVDKINKAKQHPFLVGLREDIKTCWAYIEPNTTLKYVQTRNGKQRKLPMSSKTKWAVYFQLERKVLNSINGQLINGKNNCFLEHDGWSCSTEVDVPSLQHAIQAETGFKVNVEYCLQ